MNTTLIHEVHDMWPATLIELGGMSKSHPFIRIIQKAENSAYKKSDAVVSIPQNAESYMMKHGLEKGKFYHIPNGVVAEEWKDKMALPKDMEFALNQLHEEDKFVVGYFGGHALSNALDTLLDAAKLLKTLENVHIVLVGKGVEKNRLIKRCQDEHISNITFFDAVDKRCIPNLLFLFDCIYMGTSDSPLYRFGLGLNKFYDAMMSSKPVVLSTNAKDTIIQKYNCGMVVPAEDPESINNAIRNIVSMTEDDRLKFGENGKKAVEEKFFYEKLSKDFENVMGNSKKKNILLINHYAGSPEMGMEFRPYYFAREWVKKGHRVDIIAADYSHLRRKNPVITKDFDEEVIDGIHYHWIHTGQYDGNGGKRAITMFQFVGKLWLNAKKIARKLKPDVVITSSTYPLDTYAGQRIKRFCRGGSADT